MNNNETDNYTWAATAESKGNAKSLRLFALLAWAVAIGLEIWAIIMLKTPPISMAWLIGLIIAIMGFAILGSVLWKKSNRLDPASEKDKTRFFIQNQLGVIISIIAFLPLVVLIFTNKDLNGKQKGIIGSVAVVAMLIASIVGIDFNPASIEQYTKQTQEVEGLMGTNKVYWAASSSSYHLFHDCSYINSDRTKAIFDGTVAKARELKNITDICDRCKHRVEKEKALKLQGKTLETK